MTFLAIFIFFSNMCLSTLIGFAGITVIGKMVEAMPPLIQFSVQLREKDVGEDRA